MPHQREPWWKSAVVYQIYPRSFADSDGDGIGDLGGVRAHLDHLEALGVDVLWLSPIYPSPQDDNGYDIADYQDVDPVFGTLEDLDALTPTSTRRGMRLIMDLVVNHTSDEHPWFVESRSSKDNPKRDWYWWREKPNNWTSAFSGSAWELDEATGEHYLHLFSRKQPDLNWENPEVRQRGLRDDELVAGPGDRRVPDGRHQHDLQGPRAARRRLGEAAGGGPAASTTSAARGSTSSCRRCTARSSRAATRCSTSGRCRASRSRRPGCFTDPARDELDMVFQFEHVNLDQRGNKWNSFPLDLRDLKRSFGRWQEGLAETGWNTLYWNNHDQPRIVSRWGDDGEHRVRSAKALGTLLHLHRGTPYVYQGEELGMTNVPFDTVEAFRDIESLNHYAEAVANGEDPDAVLATMRPMSRDNARTPMQWDGSRARRLHDGRAVDPGQPQPHGDQRGRPRSRIPTRSSTTTGS